MCIECICTESTCVRNPCIKSSKNENICAWVAYIGSNFARRACAQRINIADVFTWFINTQGICGKETYGRVTCVGADCFWGTKVRVTGNDGTCAKIICTRASTRIDGACTRTVDIESASIGVSYTRLTSVECTYVDSTCIWDVGTKDIDAEVANDTNIRGFYIRGSCAESTYSAYIRDSCIVGADIEDDFIADTYIGDASSVWTIKCLEIHLQRSRILKLRLYSPALQTEVRVGWCFLRLYLELYAYKDLSIG